MTAKTLIARTFSADTAADVRLHPAVPGGQDVVIPVRDPHSLIRVSSGERKMQITWLGHSGFRIDIAGAVLLIDPWLIGNPMFPANQRSRALQGATHVVVTHGHGDHMAQSIGLALELDLPLVGPDGLIQRHAARDGARGIGFNRGGTVTLAGARLTMVAASHSLAASTAQGAAPYAGAACGYMIAGEGHTIYLSGETDIMADMAWMAELHQPDIGLLAAGGRDTMDMERAAFAARKYFNFRTVIPYHYRGLPRLAQDATPLRMGLPPGIEMVEPQVMSPIQFSAGAEPRATSVRPYEELRGTNGNIRAV
jgi:L-ascorbate metabolism protein UlaG (beta-lactamase superfamily)